MKRILLLCIVLLSGFYTSVLAQERTITGTVTSAVDGTSIPGVSVVLKGTTTGTVTNVDGDYRISVPGDGGVLQFSFVGLVSQEVEIGARSVIDVVLQSDVKQLNEIVVVAYGEQTRQSITGSITEINEEELGQIQASHVIQGLQGKVPGVQIINQNGQPGEAPAIRFRGIGSINASSEPLYVVDGVPFNGNINSISPHDIASMTFLKDASANALYGSRGANGVILITTKKGKSGLEINFDAKYGFNDRAVPEYDVITDPGQFYEAWYDRARIGLINEGESPEDAANRAAAGLISGDEFSLGYNNYDVADNQVIDPSTGRINPNANLLYHDDWQDALFDESVRQEYYLSLRSKAEKIGTYLSLGYLNDEGYAINSGFQRFNTRFSIDYDYSEALKFGGNFNYASTEQDAPVQNVATNTFSNLFSWSRNVAPIYPIYARDENGEFILNDGERVFDFGDTDDGIPGVRPYGAFNNPVATSLLDIDENNFENLSARLYGKLNFFEHFTFTYNFSIDNYNGNITEFATPIGGDAKSANGRLTTTANKNQTIAHQQLLNWNRSFGHHTFSALLGHESNNNKFKLLNAQRTNLAIPDLPILDNSSTFQSLRGYEREYNVEGYFGRITYSYFQKYFLNANYRRDGSSVFHPDNRWGNFYGLGAAWMVSEEDFFSGVEFINSLKVKASYGQQGNDAILYSFNRTIIGDNDNRNYYAYLTQHLVVNSGGGELGVQPYQELGNPDLKWETSTNINAGFEIWMLNERLNLNAEYFKRSVKDMLFHLPQAPSSGAPTIPENIGDMENNGVEISIIADVIKQSDFNWRFSINGTHYKNKVTRLPEDEGIDDGDFRLEEGRSRYDYFMRQYAGVDPENGDGLWYVDVLDGEGVPTGERTTTNEWSAATEYYVGKSAIPDLYGGISNSFTYKNFSLDVDFSFQLGGYGYDEVYQNSLTSAPSSPGQNYHKDVLDSWTPERTDTELPRIDVFDDDQTNTSDYWLTDASYLNLQNVVLGYMLPQTLLDKIGFQSARVYFAGSNLKLWSARKGYDPRLSITGAAVNEYSVVRSYSLGLSAKF